MTNRYQSASKSASEVWGVMGKMERTKMPHKQLQEQFYCKHENFICQYNGIPKKKIVLFAKKILNFFVEISIFKREAAKIIDKNSQLYYACVKVGIPQCACQVLSHRYKSVSYP